ncbi:HAD superfamily hydrolase (TIGR01493 family)/HAD superfamily hydrolase (TIGR01509 family)/HAD superfamily hydrolase (TIGR01549 family) [Nocardia alba]|uniref:HAD superfamily hydrolase (TIGR01493 family)/HAD superfamily hydrolase (TIGR01509 family)/HAD superfamily hydrolase (TIGR01549 family) n=1 Tax=Nocardia alba TaxID=225051 RepID=A0A4R1F7I1_9NOCA|nr:HAD superfamily hydrolase (TIGR01493 family)/HAD superfamily hydrolase (TIGR01509 family)/HAD superfamily hydrolase (TIGR01549 family) [Nocardia alba]
MLFDYSGTLFRLEADQSWETDPSTDLDGLLHRMTAPVGVIADFDEPTRDAWERRDLDPALHRAAYLEVLRQSGADRARAEELYGRLIDPGYWTPYPDTGVVLEALSAQSIPVAVVSNIAFDVRPAFATRGWDRHIDAFALSYEIGSMKPDPGIFEWALRKVGVAAEDALMVGDSLTSDGGAAALGCRFALVEPRRTAERPTGLRNVLREFGFAV